MGDEGEIIGEATLLKIRRLILIMSDEWKVVCEAALLKVLCILVMSNKGEIISESSPLKATGFHNSLDSFIVLMADLE